MACAKLCSDDMLDSNWCLKLVLLTSADSTTVTKFETDPIDKDPGQAAGGVRLAGTQEWDSYCCTIASGTGPGMALTRGVHDVDLPAQCGMFLFELPDKEGRIPCVQNILCKQAGIKYEMIATGNRCFPRRLSFKHCSAPTSPRSA
jgi:hypothetical protein